MKNVEITVIISVKKKFFSPAVFSLGFPEGVVGTVKISAANIDVHKQGAVLLITDNADLARSFINRGLKSSYTVFIGESSRLGNELENVTDVWSPFDENVILKKRYLLLLDYIRAVFSA